MGASQASESSAELAATQRAYEAGDYRRARQLGAELAQAPKTDAERAAAEAILRRIRPDWVQAGVLLACAALFVAVVVVYLR